MKRNMSSDSDLDDDVFDDNSKGTPTQSNESCQLLNRKKRRGIIEKRRRDRINNSLTELRRLVPTAFEKQGSAKLEKAEILQMTVDHLKMLHAKGFDAFAFDPHKFAMDYHSIGFRECAAEVARYLVTVEGMDIQDPLRLRLMSHLQCYSAQRELAAKQHHASTSWNAFGSSNASPFTSATPTGTMSSMMPPPPTHESHHQPPMTSSSNCSEPSRLGQSLTPLDTHTHLMNHGHHHHPHHHHHQHPHAHHMGQGGQSHLGVASPRAPTGSMQIQAASSSTSSSGAPGTGSLPGHTMGQPQAQYLNVNTHSFSTLSPPSGYSPTSTTAHGQAGHSVKPYRPWGAELAY